MASFSQVGNYVCGLSSLQFQFDTCKIKQICADLLHQNADSKVIFMIHWLPRVAMTPLPLTQCRLVWLQAADLTVLLQLKVTDLWRRFKKIISLMLKSYFKNPLASVSATPSWSGLAGLWLHTGVKINKRKPGHFQTAPPVHFLTMAPMFSQ